MIIYQANDTQRADVQVSQSSLLKHTLLGQHKVDLSFALETYVNFSLGDYILFKGATYTVQKQPVVKKSKANEYQYDIEFFSRQYDYDNVLYLLNSESDFPLRGTLETFLQLAIDNMNRVAVGSPYSLGAVPTTEYKDLTFSGESCLNVIQKVCKEFGMEYELSGDGFTLTSGANLGNATGLAFQFKQGLRNIERKELNDGVFVTRLYPYGAKRNTIASTYGHNRLRLATAPYYLETNVAQFGVIEKHKIFEEIYPRREGTVSAVNATDETKFTDASMDFDVNAQLTSSVAKVTFNSGLLVGYEFEISSYNNATKEFTIIPITNDQDTTLPNATQKPGIGDTYVIHDIVMPSSYIVAAEAELLAAAQAFLAEYSSPNVVYTIQPDPVWFETNLISLNAGDLIQVTDTDFGITIDTKIIELTQSVQNPYLYTIKVGARAQVTYLTRVLDGVNANRDQILMEEYDRTLDRLRIAQRIKDLQTVTESIFDPSGDYFDPTKIKPLSIETAALAVGARPLNMQFNGLNVELNLNGNPNQYALSLSTLIHFTIEDTPREWAVVANSGTIADNNSRYLYAQVASAVGQTGGAWLISDQQLTVDSTPGQYTFLVGVIHAVANGVRGMSMLYGQTFINGRFITTGRIQSLDQENYLDLDTNQFNLGNAGAGIDWNVTNPNALTIRGAILQSQSGSSFPAFVYRGTYNNALTYYEGDGVVYNGSTYLYINGTPASGQVPDVSPTYWDLIAQAGSDGNDGLPGAPGADGVTYYTWVKYADTPTTGMSDSPQNKEYIGLAYNKTTPVESINYADYTWALFKGDQGVPGADGADGQPTYTWIKYADTPTTGMSDNPSGKSYLGLAHNKTSPTESLVYADYSWSLIKGETGPQGPQGDQGVQGAAGINGTNGVDGVDGNDAQFYVPGSFAPAEFAGKSDCIITLDQDTNGSVNGGEFRLQMSYLEDSKGVLRFDTTQMVNLRQITDYGEGRAGIFFVFWITQTMHTRYTANASLYDNNNIMCVAWNGSSWSVVTNTGLVPGATFAAGDVLLAAVEAKATSGGLTGLYRFYTGGQGLDAFNSDTEMHNFAEFDNEADILKQWRHITGTGELTIVRNQGSLVTGGTYLRFGNNSGNDERRIVSLKRMPWDKNCLYKVELRVRRPLGAGTLYAGIVGWDENGDYCNSTGSISSSNQHYVAASGSNPGTGWETFVGYFKGSAATGDTGVHPDASDPAVLHDNVAYISPMLYCNLSGATGTMEVDYIKIVKLENAPVAFGSWSSTVTYVPGSTVKHRGRTWQCIRENLNIQPPQTTYWRETGVTHAYNYRGAFSASAGYYWSDEVCDIVKNGSTYYRRASYTGGTADVGAWNAGEWEVWGAQFNMVATDTLLAENAYIADWIIKSGKLTSQGLSGTNPRVSLDGLNGAITARDTVSGWWGSTEFVHEVAPASGYIRTTASANGQSTGLNVLVDGQGTQSFGPGNPAITDRLATVYSPLVGKPQMSDSTKNSAGVVGHRISTHDNSFGGVFDRLATTGLIVGTRLATATVTLNKGDFFVRCFNTATITINLDATPKIGQMYIIWRANTGAVTISGNGNNVRKGTATSTTDALGTAGRASICVWDGTFWSILYCGL